jgi:hypothetical protein
MPRDSISQALQRVIDGIAELPSQLRLHVDVQKADPQERRMV